MSEIFTPTREDAVKVIDEAHRLIGIGWCQSTGKRIGNHIPGDENCDDRYCLGTALEVSDIYDSMTVRGLVIRALNRVTGVTNPLGGLVQWNDKPGRNQHEVLAALESAKEILLSDVLPPTVGGL